MRAYQDLTAAEWEALQNLALSPGTAEIPAATAKDLERKGYITSGRYGGGNEIGPGDLVYALTESGADAALTDFDNGLFTMTSRAR